MYIYVHIYVIITVIIKGQLSCLASLLDYVPDPTRTPCGTYTRTYICTYYLILKGDPTYLPTPLIHPTVLHHHHYPTRPTRTYTCKYIGAATCKSDESTLPRGNQGRGRRDRDKPTKQGAVREDLGRQEEVGRRREGQKEIGKCTCPNIQRLSNFLFFKN